ncbi:MAG: LysR family transcriptional regulator [Clostridiales Family XIII bacterium]|nr:LysR family transcriptional regulator [Clostridiales Family XIII bacterium]
MVNLQHLKYFITAAELENLSLAAAELYIAQPHLSKVLASLEKDFGSPLFDRVGRNIKLNKYGAELLKMSRNVFREIEETKNSFAEMRDAEQTQIKIALNIPSLLPLLLKNYIGKRGNITLDTVIGSNNQLKKLLEDRIVDFCIVSPPIETDKIASVELITEELKLFLPPMHPYSGHEAAVPLSAFKDENFLVFKKGYGIRDNIDRIFEHAGFEPRISYESEVNDLLISLVELGMGVSLLPVHKWESRKTTGNAVSISTPRCERQIGLSYLRNSRQTQAAQEFQEYIILFFKNAELPSPAARQPESEGSIQA